MTKTAVELGSHLPNLIHRTAWYLNNLSTRHIDACNWQLAASLMYELDVRWRIISLRQLAAEVKEEMFRE